MSLLHTLFGSKEEREIKAAFKKFRSNLPPELYMAEAMSIIQSEIFLYVTHASELRSIPSIKIRTYTAIADLSQRELLTGEYHMFRGVLSPNGLGPSFERIFSRALQFIIQEGAMTQMDANRRTSYLKKSLSEVG